MKTSGVQKHHQKNIPRDRMKQFGSAENLLIPNSLVLVLSLVAYVIKIIFYFQKLMDKWNENGRDYVFIEWCFIIEHLSNFA